MRSQYTLPFIPFTQVELTCQQCGNRYEVSKQDLSRSRYCSRACLWASNRVCPGACSSAAQCAPTIARFWTFVDKNGPAPAHVPGLGACWIWTGWHRLNGYGGFSHHGGTYIAAHRFSYASSVGPIVGGLWVLHHCDTRRCVRPDHLFLGDRADNTADMVTRRRQGHDNYPGKNAGSTHGMSKLTEQDVLDIRRRRAEGETGVSLARVFGVSDGLITMIVKRRRWSHI